MTTHQITGTTFNLPSNRNLKKTLGEHDALVEYMECSCRLFQKKYESEGGNLNAFLKRESTEVGIYLRDISLKDYRNIINKSYLIFPYACFDEFIYDFAADIRNLVDTDFKIKRNDDETKFEGLLSSLKTIGIYPTISDIERNLLAYYRLHRNNLSHRGDANLNKDYKIIDKGKVKELYPSLSGLRDGEHIEFDDFILCTANIKNIADQLVASVEDKIDWTNIVRSCKSLHKLNKYTGQRKRAFVSKYISSIFGIVLDPDQCENILGSLE